MTIQIEEVLRQLGNDRKLFHSEDDFKFAFAWKIKEMYDVEIRLEFPVDLEKRIYVDILIITDEGWIPIELKYKTNMLEYDTGEILHDNYNLITQSGEIDARYGYLKDIERIEKIREKYGEFIEGYAIFLTNVMKYSEKTSDKFNYHVYAIYEGITKQGPLIYPGKNDNYSEITLKGNDNEAYVMNWKEYSVLNKLDKNNKFIYLLSKIKK